MGYTEVLLRGTAVHGSSQLLPPLRRGLCRASCTSDGSRQPTTARFVTVTVWTADAQVSFDALKNGPVLGAGAAHFRPGQPRGVHDRGEQHCRRPVAAILTQPDDDGRQHLVAY
jgi:hypothetical protein